MHFHDILTRPPVFKLQLKPNPQRNTLTITQKRSHTMSFIMLTLKIPHFPQLLPWLIPLSQKLHARRSMLMTS